MPKHNVSCAAKCPFYKAHERHEIYCRGPKDGSAIHVAFAVPTDKKEWMKQYCESISGYSSCVVKKMLEDCGM